MREHDNSPYNAGVGGLADRSKQAASLFGCPVQTNPHIPAGTVVLMREGKVQDVVDVMNENARLRAAATLALTVAESWIHDQLDGTHFLDSALAELAPVRAALSKEETR